MQRALCILGCLSALLVAAASGDGGNGSDTAHPGAAFLARPTTSVNHVAEVKNATVPGNASEAQPSSEDSLAAESVANSGSPCNCMASWEHLGHHSECSKTSDADYAWCRVEESCTSKTYGVFGPWKKCEIACNCLASWEHLGHHSGCSKTLDAGYSWCRVEESCSSKTYGVFGAWRKC